MPKSLKLDHSRCWVDHCTIGFGWTLYTYWNRELGSPIGFVWGLSHRLSFDVYGSYVEPWARRQGVRTRMNLEIFKVHPVIKTWAGSKDGGKEFLAASGYKWDSTAMQWCLKQRRTR